MFSCQAEGIIFHENGASAAKEAWDCGLWE